jgi:hypothetical protein
MKYSDSSVLSLQPKFNILSYSNKGIHPDGVQHYQPKEDLDIPSQGDSKRYGTLTDETSYSEYAWEFLRRNRFYQAMIDEARPSFNIEDWGYRASPSHEASCGIIRPFKHYSDGYAETTIRSKTDAQDGDEENDTNVDEDLRLRDISLNYPKWEPGLLIEDRLKSTLRSRQFSDSHNEYPGLQVPFFFDITQTFGPGSIGLKVQADKAVETIEKYLTTKGLQPGLMYQPSKEKLRRFLRLADLLTYPQKMKADGDESSGCERQLLTVTQAAHHLKEFNFIPEGEDQDESVPQGSKTTKEQRESVTRERLKVVRSYVYGWKCLNLLTYDHSGVNSVQKKRKMSQKRDTSASPKTDQSDPGSLDTH